MAVAVDPQTVAEATALIEATAQARQNLTATTTAAVTAQVRAFNGWYDHAAITRLAKNLAALTGSGQRQTATLTSSYMTRLQRLLQGRTGRTAPRVPVADLRGVPLDSVFGRLADEYRWLRSDGVSVAGVQAPGLDEARALEQVVTRAATMVDQSTSLAMVTQWAQATDHAPQAVTGYRRVLHPELSRGGSCGLCIAASSRVYKTGALMPIHARCACVPCIIAGPVGGPGDVGALVNAEDLSRFYSDAGGSTAAAALKATRYHVETSSELGPQLVAHKTRPAPYVQKARTAAQRAGARESAARSRAGRGRP